MCSGNPGVLTAIWIEEWAETGCKIYVAYSFTLKVIDAYAVTFFESRPSHAFLNNRMLVMTDCSGNRNASSSGCFALLQTKRMDTAAVVNSSPDWEVECFSRHIRPTAALANLRRLSASGSFRDRAMAWILLKVLSLFLFAHWGIEAAKPGRSEAHRSASDRTIESVVPKNYDPLERPSPQKEPTFVHVSVHFSHIEWTFDRLHVVMYLRQRWTDTRLKRRKASTVLCKPADVQNHMWFPDTFLANMVDETTVLNAGFVRVASNGEVVYSTLLKSSFACPPHSPSKRLVSRNGEIDCEIDLESFAYSAGEVELKWVVDQQAATVDEAYDDMVKMIGTGEMTMHLTRGTYSRLTVNLTLDTGLSGEQLDYTLRRFYGRPY